MPVPEKTAHTFSYDGRFTNPERMDEVNSTASSDSDKTPGDAEPAQEALSYRSVTTRCGVNGNAMP
jgi:hypothetical protein